MILPTIDIRLFLRRLLRAPDSPPHATVRFAEFGRGVSGVIHDLANPLTVISLSIERLRSDARIRSAEARKHIEAAARAARNMDLFLSTMRKQLGSGGPQVQFDASAEIRGVMKLLRAIAKKSYVRIKYRSTRAVFIWGDPVKFFRVVSNIVSNAIDSYASFPAGKNKVIIIRIIADKKSAEVSVRDFGCGIPKHLHKPIFEPFYTTKQKREGAAGLGLSIVKNIVEKDFGGKIKVESAPGRGSTFKITMPNTSKA